MGLIQDCEELFGSSDLYKLLHLDKDATKNTIKRAYRKLSLKVHPDRALPEEKKSATKKFQVLSKVSRILLDDDLRSIYDTDGEIDDDSLAGEKNIKDWTKYWKTLFNLSIDDMKKFEESYRFSQSESDDLKSIYSECKGDMDMIFERQLCSYIEDEDRYRKILEDAIVAGEITDYKIFSKEPKAKRRKRLKLYQGEAKEAEEEMKKRGLGKASTEDDLKQLILQRQGNRQKEMDSFLSNLEAKYSKPSKRKKTAGSSKGK